MVAGNRHRDCFLGQPTFHSKLRGGESREVLVQGTATSRDVTPVHCEVRILVRDLCLEGRLWIFFTIRLSEAGLVRPLSDRAVLPSHATVARRGRCCC